MRAFLMTDSSGAYKSTMSAVLLVVLIGFLVGFASSWTVWLHFDVAGRSGCGTEQKG